MGSHGAKKRKMYIKSVHSETTECISPSFLQIITDRMLFHDECAIYPVGFCSTRFFASMKNPEQQCLYTCQIKDGGTGPQVYARPHTGVAFCHTCIGTATPSFFHIMLPSSQTLL